MTHWFSTFILQRRQDLAGNPGDDLPAEAFPFRAATASNGGSVSVPASSNSVPCEVMWGTWGWREVCQKKTPEILGRWLWCTAACCFWDFFKDGWWQKHVPTTYFRNAIDPWMKVKGRKLSPVGVWVKDFTTSWMTTRTKWVVDIGNSYSGPQGT